MSQWANSHPELAGTYADPWSIHPSYRRAVSHVKAVSGDYCRDCERFLVSHERGLCEDCKR